MHIFREVTYFSGNSFFCFLQPWSIGWPGYVASFSVSLHFYRFLYITRHLEYPSLKIQSYYSVLGAVKYMN